MEFYAKRSFGNVEEIWFHPSVSRFALVKVNEVRFLIIIDLKITKKA
jgi:hypothetical protein